MQPVLFPAQMRAHGVRQWVDGEDRIVGVGEAVCGALKGCGGAGGGTSTLGAPCGSARAPSRGLLITRCIR
jgi:hypothetical protein